MRTKAKRKLLPEVTILTIKYRMGLGVPLNTAVKILCPHISNVVAIRLVKWHTDMEAALAVEDFETYDVMDKSMFPKWLPHDQPDDACYVGTFPHGYWENSNVS